MAGGIIQGAGSYMAGKQKADAAKMQGAFARQQAEFNARQAEKDAALAAKLGEKEAVKNEVDIKLLMGDQRAALAAQGIVVDEGTAMALQEQTKEIGLADSLTIRNNARREAMGFKREALDLRISGQFAQTTARNRAAAARFEGAVGLAKGYYDTGKSIATMGQLG